MRVPIGIIPYPITFLATDLISELYGKSRANYVVFVGFILNIFLILICFIADIVPIDTTWRSTVTQEEAELFPNIFNLMIRGTAASMVAYLTAQFVDVRVFHFLKEKTQGRHLWLRNNGSTLFSQLIDTTAVILVIFLGVLPFSTILEYIFFGYLFKVAFALFDTPFFYLGTRYLKKYIT